MTSRILKRSPRTLILGVASSLALICAQPATAQANDSVSADMTLSLPASSLSESLVLLGQIAGVNIIAPDELVAGKQSESLTGEMSVEDALSALLKEHGLEANLRPSGAYLVSERAVVPQSSNTDPQPAPQPVALVEEEPQVQDVIIVEGTKLSQSLQDLDVSAEVFTAERLARERIVDVGEIFLKTPNVNSRGGAGGSFTIRGISRGGVGGAGQGVTSNVYIDGAPLSSNGLGSGPTSLWDVQQVEVLRGPQSSVQGRNALAGAIIVTTADPTYDFEAKGRASYATYDTVQLAGAISGPIIADQLAARLAIDFQESDGFITNTIVDRSADRRESLLVRGKLLFEPQALPALSTKLTLDYLESDLGESRPIVSTNFGTASPQFETFDYLDYEGNGRFPNNENEVFRVVSDTSYALNSNWTARGIFTYEDASTDRLFGDPDFVEEFNGLTFNQFDEEVYSAEARLDFEYDTFRGLIGSYYFEEEVLLDRDIGAVILPALLSVTPPPLRPLVVVDPADSLVSQRDGNTTETNNWAIFGQLEYDFSPEWTLSLGFRYDEEEFSIPDEFSAVSATPETCVATLPAILLNPAVPDPFLTTSLPCGVLANAFVPPQFPLGGDIEQSFDAFLPRVALTYNFNEDSSVFVSYQRGYRAGGSETFIADNPSGFGFIRDINLYDPEYLDTIEVGTRNIFMDGALTFNANVFYSSYDDAQIRLTGQNAADASDDITENAGEATLFGAEILLDYAPTDEWGVFASLGLLDAEYDEYRFAADANGVPVNPIDPRFANLAGNTVPNAPEVTFTIGANYQHRSGFFANGSLSYIGEQFDGVDNLQEADFRAAFEAFNLANGTDLNVDFGGTLTEVIEDRTDLTARFGYEADNFTIYAFGSNLLNEEVITNVNYGNVSPITGEVVLIGPTSETVATVNRPRVVGVGIDVNF
ncbi:MAG: TonB-dependent receptor [Pseudomonadota bacterium]